MRRCNGCSTSCRSPPGTMSGSTPGGCSCCWPIRPPRHTPAGCWSSTIPVTARTAPPPRRGVWAYGDQARTPVDAARDLAWGGPDQPGDWVAVTRTFRDEHTQTWWAADACLGWWGPDGATRLVVATADPATLPEKATWYLATNLPRPGGPREADSPHPAASLAEITRIYGIRHWAEQGYKQVKDELGWADFQVRSDIAIRRHQALVSCAFCFCWAAWSGD